MAKDFHHPTGGTDLRFNSQENRIGYDGTGQPGRGAQEHFDQHEAKAAKAGKEYHSTWENDNSKDFICPQGTPIYAVFDGKIGESNFGIKPGYENADTSSEFHGIRLHLEKSDGANEAFYQHLDHVAPGISPGVQVTAGQIIGYSGVGGDVPHLHFALQDNSDHGYGDWDTPYHPVTDSVYYTDPALGPASPNTTNDFSNPGNPPPDATPPVPEMTPGNANATDVVSGQPTHVDAPAAAPAPPADFTPGDQVQTPPDANMTGNDGAAVHANASGADAAGPPADMQPGQPPAGHDTGVPPADMTPLTHDGQGANGADHDGASQSQAPQPDNHDDVGGAL